MVFKSMLGARGRVLDEDHLVGVAAPLEPWRVGHCPACPLHARGVTLYLLDDIAR